MITRRSFVLGSTSVIGLGLFGCQSVPKTRPKSANEQVRVAVVGVRSRGNAHVRGFWNVPNVEVVAICDVDRDILATRAAEYTEAGHPVDTAVDLRKLLDRSDIDAVALATPNHQHALQTIWACQAGKDVYVEKPVSHNIWEGAQAVRAARKYDRIVMAGTQCRSSQGIAEAIEWVQAGNLGSIELARGLCYKPRQSIGKVAGPQEPPASVDYDLWIGPAPMRPLQRKQLHYDWHWDLDTGNGDLGNQGVHQMDICRWAVGEPDLPTGVMSIGGRFGYDDDGNTPNTHMVLLDYATAPVLFEVRGLPRDRKAQREAWNVSGMDKYMGASIGVIVHCEGGHLLVPNYSTAIAFDGAGAEVGRWQGASDHYAHFIDHVRSRNVSGQRADIREGHVSSAMCHMGLVAHQLGRQATGAELREAVADNANASEAFERMQVHLDANEVDLANTPATHGAWLAFDPKRERFEDRRANALLARDYREPFVVPERV